ncbi:TetR/AcrR family transcriptional regulator C-terminal domain-containing protein [Actinomadura sp. 6N118]|uniref:TetR/AcrR family transcriptional regulator C-terminal domain-containing protein n=1 Tax=Actinomadura sp. 6N118 TaxID=3375151 RepID=UPI003794210B
MSVDDGQIGVVTPVQQRADEIAATQDPLLASAAPYLAVSDHDAEFDYGLELLIAGLAAKAGVAYDGGPSTTRSKV